MQVTRFLRVARVKGGIALIEFSAIVTRGNRGLLRIWVFGTIRVFDHREATFRFRRLCSHEELVLNAFRASKLNNLNL